jgi:hypothetical protein
MEAVAPHGGDASTHEPDASGAWDDGSRNDPVDTRRGRTGEDAAGGGCSTSDGAELASCVRSPEQAWSAGQAEVGIQTNYSQNAVEVPNPQMPT